MINTYIFDLDDTIIDSSIYQRMYHELLREIVETLKISEIDLQKEITKIKNETGRERIDTYLLCKNLNCIEVYYNVLERFARHTYTLKINTIPTIFKKIHSEKKKIGVVSGSQERTIKVFLDRFNLSQYVDFTATGNKLTVLFWVLLEKKHSLYKSDTLVIDDSDEVLQIAEHSGYKIMNAKNINDMDKLGY